MSTTSRARFPGLRALGDPDAVAGDGALTALLERWWQAAAQGGVLAPGIRAGVLVPGIRAEVISTTEAGTPPPITLGAEVQVSTDHANLSMASGDVLVKFLADPAPGEDHGLRMARHLAAVGGDIVPALLGALVGEGPQAAESHPSESASAEAVPAESHSAESHPSEAVPAEADPAESHPSEADPSVAGRDGRGVRESVVGEPVVLAVATRYLGAGQEGWSRFRDLARAVLEADPDSPRARDDVWQASRALAQDAGATLARFHLAVATPSDVWPRPRSLADEAVQARWRAQARAVWDRACEALDDAEVTEAPTDAARQRLERIGRRLAAVWPADDPEPEPTPVMPIHGDLHVGQLLTVEGRMVVTDLDGDPSLPPSERARPASPAKDLAALLRSVDHVGRLAALRGGQVPMDAPAVDDWIVLMRTEATTAYRARLTAAGAADLLDVAWVARFETAQLAHELHYAMTRLPMWLPVAETAADAWLEGRITDAT